MITLSGNYSNRNVTEILKYVRSEIILSYLYNTEKMRISRNFLTITKDLSR